MMKGMRVSEVEQEEVNVSDTKQVRYDGIRKQGHVWNYVWIVVLLIVVVSHIHLI